jgi:hypothetical protein
MNDKEKQKLIEKYLTDIQSGKEEKLVLAEMESTLGPEFVSALTSKGKGETQDYREEENPLLLLAEENGALRALMKNIYFDLSTLDDLSKRLLVEEYERLGQIKHHFEKIDKVCLCFLDDEKSLEIRNAQKKIMKEYHDLEETKDIQSLPLLLEDIEKNIIHENHFLLPLLEEKLDDAQLRMIWIAFMGFDKCLLR